MSSHEVGSGRAEVAVPAGFAITVDGAEVPVRAGQTLAAALLAAGRRSTRRTRFAGRPRGVFCGIGICFDCLVVCNGEPGVRACLRPAAPGDTVETGRYPGAVAESGGLDPAPTPDGRGPGGPEAGAELR